MIICSWSLSTFSDLFKLVLLRDTRCTNNTKFTVKVNSRHKLCDSYDKKVKSKHSRGVPVECSYLCCIYRGSKQDFKFLGDFSKQFCREKYSYKNKIRITMGIPYGFDLMRVIKGSILYKTECRFWDSLILNQCINLKR